MAKEAASAILKSPPGPNPEMIPVVNRLSLETEAIDILLYALGALFDPCSAVSDEGHRCNQRRHAIYINHKRSDETSTYTWPDPAFVGADEKSETTLLSSP